MLELPGPIESLTYTSTYQTPMIEELKYTSLDVKAVDSNGREFIVEMQVEGNEKFGKRALYYLAKSYVGQRKNLKPLTTGAAKKVIEKLRSPLPKIKGKKKVWLKEKRKLHKNALNKDLILR